MLIYTEIIEHLPIVYISPKNRIFDVDSNKEEKRSCLEQIETGFYLAISNDYTTTFMTI